MADLLDKFQPTQSQVDEIVALTGCNPLEIRMERVLSPTRAIIHGRECVLLGTNNYLGLTFDEKAVQAAHDAIDFGGTGTTGSRVANGSYGSHQDLERALADFYGQKHAMLFTTGYQANLGFIAAIAGKDDYVLIDSDSHASIYDGCKLGDATVIRFRHSDPQDLDRRLQRLGAGANKLVIVEGIYSMIGDTAPLKEIVEVSKRNGAYIMVDEAHSVGVLGETGRGLAEREGVEDDIDFTTGTFSKSFGTIGGFCVSNHAALETIRLTARAYMFTASPTPSIVASAAANLENIRTRPEIRARLWQNTDKIYDGLKALGFKIGDEKTPVIGVQMPSIPEGLLVWQTLLEHGVYVNLALPPATPNGICLLRCSVCAAHSDAQIETIFAAFRAAKEAVAAMDETLLAAE